MGSVDAFLKEALSLFKPPPKLTLSEWADTYAYLSPESSAEPGRWRTIPYQKGIMDAITDPTVERVSVIKSARVGYTKIIGHVIGYFIHYDPCPIMVVQPTESDAEQYSKEEIAPMIRDTPVLHGKVSDAKSRDSSNTILQKQFNGGTLSLVGANSPRGFRRVSRRVVIFDETDGYPPSAGAEGDQIKLGIRRADYYWNRKILSGSTPTTDIRSRIKPMYEESDQRKYYVPCPHCGELQVLEFSNLKWDEGNPMGAWFECVACHKKMEHSQKKWMVENGEWMASEKFNGHAGFHIWAAYSYSPNATWGHIATEFLESKKLGKESLKTFVNTVLGETWEERGESPDWERLYDRREPYELNRPPAEAMFLTAGVDVQADRLECEIVAWGQDKQSWSIDFRIFMGNTATDVPWAELDKVLFEEWTHPNGVMMRVAMVAVDSGFHTQHVYSWARKHSSQRVMAVKGSDRMPVLLSRPSKVDLTVHGKVFKSGFQVWSSGVSVAKNELYSWLKLPSPVDGEPYPSGFCHFPEYESEYFKQLTAEQLVRRVVKGFPKFEWEKTRARNEALDCRLYARVAAHAFGLDRFTERQWERLRTDFGGTRIPKAQPPQDASSQSSAAPSPEKKRKKERASSFW